jgi:hypothetical protein
MGLRFYRRFRIAPGIRVNLSRRGLSTSFGHRGAWYTIGPGRRRLTVGLPGSGIRYTSTSSARSSAKRSGALTWLLLLLLLLVLSAWWHQR